MKPENTDTEPQTANESTTDGEGLATPTCSPFWYGIGAFFVAPVAAIFCILMGAMMILAWPFIPFLCYMQKKEEISKGDKMPHELSQTKGGERPALTKTK